MFALRSKTTHSLLSISAHRRVSTLPSNPDIYVHPQANNTYVLSFLPSAPTPRTALGTTTTLPPTPHSFTENPQFVSLLKRVVSTHAASDPLVQSEALAFASPGGHALLGGRQKRRESSSGAANYQGGTGGGGVGGWIHVYDQRGVPAFGRIAETEDIFGSLLVNGEGKIVQPAEWGENRMYRVLTGERGPIRLSEYLKEKMVEALRREEKLS